MRGSSVLFSTGKNNWQTPPALFKALHDEFHFTVDGAADDLNHLLPRWFGPGSEEGEDALTVNWTGGRLFVNPPYTNVKEFVNKGYRQRECALSVFLIPARTDTRYWHECIWDQTKHDWRDGVKGRFIKGRVKFINPDSALLRGTKMNGSNNSAPFPSAIIIFGAK